MTSQQIRQASSGVSNFDEQRKQLTPGDIYTLSRIYQKEEKMCYVFSSPSGVREELLFESIKQAEKFISELKNETIPDYSSAYINQTD